MEKLELKHLASYLPYGLKCEILNYESDYVGEKYGIINGYYLINGDHHYTFKDRNTAGKNAVLIKPILRPLSDLTKEIEHNGKTFIPIESKTVGFLRLKDGKKRELSRSCFVLEVLEYDLVQKLLEWHFDVFGLIEKGLAIDINTL